MDVNVNKFNFEYLPRLQFADLSVYKKIVVRCARAEFRDRMGTRQKWLGAYYAQEIAKGYMPKVLIEWIDERVGYGVMAAENLPASTFVGEYTGLVRRRERYVDQYNNYCFDYAIGEGRRSPYLIDAEQKGNYTRFINHSDEPNLEPLSVYSEGIMHVILIAIRPISRGTQLSYDYGMDYWSKRPEPILIDS